jgi:hypothetical protein
MLPMAATLFARSRQNEELCLEDLTNSLVPIDLVVSEDYIFLIFQPIRSKNFIIRVIRNLCGRPHINYLYIF